MRPSRGTATTEVMNPHSVSKANGICPVADSGSAGWRPPILPGGGQWNCPGLVGEGLHPLAGGGLGEADGVAGGEHDVGVVQEPVDGRTARRWGCCVDCCVDLIVRAGNDGEGQQALGDRCAVALDGGVDRLGVAAR